MNYTLYSKFFMFFQEVETLIFILLNQGDTQFIPHIIFEKFYEYSTNIHNIYKTLYRI